MPASLLVLALSAFAVGITEPVIMGLLSQVAGDLRVPVPSAGWLTNGCAFAAAFGAPLMAMATVYPGRKETLLMLMGIFIINNLLCAVVANYGLLMLTRTVTALCRSAFFGVGSVVAASLVAPNRRAPTVALMFIGLTLINMLGVPLGAALGQEAGWRAIFQVVTLIGVVAFVDLTKVLPNDREEEKVDLRQEMSALKGPSLWLTLGTTVLFAAPMFTLFTYVAPLFGEVTGASPRDIIWALLLIGIGLTVGNVVGGRLTNRRLGTTMAAVFTAMALASALFSWTSQALLPAEITLFLWTAAAFAAVSALQINVVHVGHTTPNLVATLGVGAFSTGNTPGAWVDGNVIDHGPDPTHVSLAAAALAALALLTTLIAFSGNGRAQTQSVSD